NKTLSDSPNSESRKKSVTTQYVAAPTPRYRKPDLDLFALALSLSDQAKPRTERRKTPRLKPSPNGRIKDSPRKVSKGNRWIAVLFNGLLMIGCASFEVQSKTLYPSLGLLKEMNNV